MIIFLCKFLSIPVTSEECQECHKVKKLYITRALCQEKNTAEIIRGPGLEFTIYHKVRKEDRPVTVTKRKTPKIKSNIIDGTKGGIIDLTGENNRKPRSDKGVKRGPRVIKKIRKPRSDKGQKRGKNRAT